MHVACEKRKKNKKECEKESRDRHSLAVDAGLLGQRVEVTDDRLGAPVVLVVLERLQLVGHYLVFVAGDGGAWAWVEGVSFFCFSWE